MAITLQDINALRQKTQAGLMDCKKALTEANGDMEAAMEILRKKGQLVAAKRSDREASEGCVLAKIDGNFGAIIALKCETDFVAKNADFVALAHQIIDAAVAAKAKTIEEVKALIIDGVSVEDAVTNRSGVTGEKMELDGYATVEGEKIIAYNHMGQNFLCTLVAFNKECSEEVGKGVAMQAAAMAPIALDEASIPQETKDAEFKAAIEKTEEDQVKKAIEVALKKAGFNLYIAENEEHLEEGIRKGEITEAQAQEIRDLKAKTAEEKRANLPAQMIEQIANGRMAKFFKEVCLLQQDYIDDNKISVAQFLKNTDKELTITDFKRYTLRAE
jgi:elongation factor Ts